MHFIFVFCFLCTYTRTIAHKCTHRYTFRILFFLLQILENVRLALVSPYFLVDVVEGEMAVRSSPECRVIVEEARLYHLLPDRRHQLTSPRTRHRRNTNTTTVRIIFHGPNPFYSVWDQLIENVTKDFERLTLVLLMLVCLYLLAGNCGSGR